MLKIKNLGFGILVLLLMVNTCSAEFSLLVSPVNTELVSPGESISYNVIVNDSDDGEFIVTENVNLSINRTIECPSSIDEDYWSPDWEYIFNPSEVRIDLPGSNFSVLTLEVPADVVPGTYNHIVEAKVWNEYDTLEPSIIQTVVINTDVNNIPEFPTVALPMLAVFGLVAIFGKRKNKV